MSLKLIKNLFVFLTFLSLILLLSYFSMTLGYMRASFQDLKNAFNSYDGSLIHNIIISSRLPRTLISIVVGAALSTAGLLTQALVRNPIASPSIFGINNGASFAVVLVITTMPFLWDYFILMAFLGALSSAFLVILISGGFRAVLNVINLALSGAAISALFYTLTFTLLAKNQIALEEMFLWIVGSVSGRKLGDVIFLFPLVGFGIIFSLFISTYLNILAMGDELASSLGLNVFLVKILIVFLIILLTAASVAIAGPIAFVDLIVPHLARTLTGSNYKVQLPFTALLGSLVLLSSDIISRFLIFPKELPVGVVTAIFCGPIFIYMIRRAGVRDYAKK